MSPAVSAMKRRQVSFWEFLSFDLTRRPLKDQSGFGSSERFRDQHRFNQSSTLGTDQNQTHRFHEQHDPGKIQIRDTKFAANKVFGIRQVLLENRVGDLDFRSQPQ